MSNFTKLEQRQRRIQIDPSCEWCHREVNLHNSCLKRVGTGIPKQLICLECLDRSDENPTNSGRWENYRRKQEKMKVTRYLIWQDDPHCKYCERELMFRETTLDHVIPRAKGGTDERENLALCCHICNNLKGDMEVEEFLKKLGEMKHEESHGSLSQNLHAGLSLQEVVRERGLFHCLEELGTRASLPPHDALPSGV